MSAGQKQKAGPYGSRRGKGFRAAGDLVQSPIRKAAEGRGFAVQRLLTHWEEIAGAPIARIAQPVKVSYTSRGFGATLVLLVPGAHAPMVQMQVPRLIERINGVYGYAAISRIRLTQSSAHGEASAKPDEPLRPAPSEEETRRAAALAEGIDDPEFRAALEQLGAYVMTRA